MAHKYNVLHVRLRLVLQEILAVRPDSLFELGCSMGVLRAELLRRLPQLQYCACDVSQSAVDSINDPNVKCVDLNREPLPFRDRRFDCVVGSGILEYIGDVPNLLGELRERLRPGGRLILSYFNMRHIYRRYVRLRGRTPFRNPTWLNDYSLDEFREVVRAAGFSIRDSIPSNLGIGGSPSIGRERWTPTPLRWLRRFPSVELFAHQVVFIADRHDLPV